MHRQSCAAGTNVTQEKVPTFGNSEAAMALQSHSTRSRSNRQVNVSQINRFVEERQMKSMFVRFVREDAGQDLIEYGLLVGLITVGAVALIGPIGEKIVEYFQGLSDALGI